MFDDFTRIDDPKERKLLHCAACKRETIHNLEARCKGRWEDDEASMSGASIYSIFRCGACDAVCYQTASWDSEDVDYDFAGNLVSNVTARQYPAPTSAHFNFNTDHTPRKLNNILEEMLYALTSSKTILATVGLRLAIEFIVKDKKCAGRNLEKKIDNLMQQGHIDNDQNKLLQEIRKRGNASAHEAKGMHLSGLIAGMAIIEGLLEKLYNGPARHAATIQRAQNFFNNKESDELEDPLD